MGALQFAKNGNYRRFYENLKIIGSQTGKKPLLMFMDAAVSVFLTGSGLSDYINYKFYEKNFRERNEYVTIGYMADFYSKAGRDPQGKLWHKSNFLANHPELTKRDFYAVEMGRESLAEFVKRHQLFVKKPVDGLGGTGVSKVRSEDIEDIEEFYQQLKKEQAHLEELIIQDEQWGKISPNSINTLRVHTSNVKGHVEVFLIVARIGNGINMQDNFHQGGVGVYVDMENCCLKGKATNKDMEEFDQHPLTKIRFDGYPIPYLDEVIRLCSQAAESFEETVCIGWDVALSNKGPLIVEANNGPGFDLPQVVMNKGLRPLLEKVKREMMEKGVW